jgi:hypothetical protein
MVSSNISVLEMLYLLPAYSHKSFKKPNKNKQPIYTTLDKEKKY